MSVSIHGVQHQLNAHKNDHRIAPEEHARRADHEKNRGNCEVMTEWGHKLS